RLLDPKFYLNADDAPGEGKLAGETKVTFDHVITPSKSEGFETFMPTPFGNEILLQLAKTAVEAEKLGQGNQPDMLCVSFSAIDYCGHKFGPYSQEVQDITLRLDRQLGDFFSFLDKKIGMKNVVVVLTADHGVAPAPEYAAQVMGLDSSRLKEADLMVDLMTKIDAKFGAGKYFLTPKIIEGNLYFNHETLEEKKIAPNEFCNFIREWALNTGKYIAGYSREQLLDGRTPGQLGEFVFNGYNAERSGDLVLVAKPLLVPGGTSGTTHGSPWGYDTHVPVLFYGSAFKPGRYADEFYITDIAATLSAALRIDHPVGSTGKPFVKALAP
ncbi:MAG: type phosphodiesterase/nucleotide pyrophosphatase, partial [Verrucomicrobia bacterium]|nr:type phosphodiesterase/nucleotide pyrophosphatase [Verrucomicrobiota bacterium]